MPSPLQATQPEEQHLLPPNMQAQAENSLLLPPILMQVFPSYIANEPLLPSGCSSALGGAGGDKKRTNHRGSRSSPPQAAASQISPLAWNSVTELSDAHRGSTAAPRQARVSRCWWRRREGTCMGCLLHSVWFGIFHECCLKMLRFVHNQYQSWGQGKALGRTSGEEMRAQSSVIYSLHLDHWDVFAPPRAAGVREGPRVSLLGWMQSAWARSRPRGVREMGRVTSASSRRPAMEMRAAETTLW